MPVPVEIEEINIDTDIALIEGLSPVDYMTDRLESMSTPTFEFEDGSVVRGFEMGQIMEKLGL